MKRERSWLAALAISGAMVLGLSSESYAQGSFWDGYSYTAPAAELIVPYNTQEGKVSYIVASNVSDRNVTTHWIFWNEACTEEVDFSICLTQNDTVVVNPMDMQAIDANNQGIGPKISLVGVRGVATVIAYETDDACTAWPVANELADEAIVGAFTLADTEVGYSFGNDAFGLGTNLANTQVEVPEPVGPDGETGGLGYEFAIQIFRPEIVEDSVVILSHIAEAADGTVAPGRTPVRFATSVVDTYEIPTSLPDTLVSCAAFHTIAGDSGNPLIPATTTVDSAGIIRLQPVSGLAIGTTYVYGIVGQAINKYGASSSMKAEVVPGSASQAFLSDLDQGLF